MAKNNLYNFEFIALCSITFLALCDVAVFYNFHLYLQQIGFLGKSAGYLARRQENLKHSTQGVRAFI